MLLAIDTSGASGGIALAHYDGEFAVVLAAQEIPGGTFSAQLIPQIRGLLNANSTRLSQVTAVAAVTGPGSFTGLRIGIAAVKGICEICKIPVVPVTMLELLAAGTSARQITTILDASRSEIYVGEFRQQNGIAVVFSEALRSISMADVEGLVLTPDLSIAAQLGCVAVPRPTPTDLALYAVRKLARGMTAGADEIDAHYIRRSDAELAVKK